MHLLMVIAAVLNPLVRSGGRPANEGSSAAFCVRGAPSSRQVVAKRRLGRGFLVLSRDGSGMGFLHRVDPGGQVHPVVCDPLMGAWGLWVSDVNRDGSPDAVVTLRKRAKFDPVVENRLHVYALHGNRCAPLWRGTRLAGRFDAVTVKKNRLLALERVGGGRRRVAWYRWTGFGYAVERVVWKGRGRVPRRLGRLLSRSPVR